MKLRSLLALATTLAFVPLSRAQFVYDNIGNSNPYSPGFFSAPVTNFGFVGDDLAFRFTAGATLLLDYAELAVWGNSSITVAVFANNGTLPGTLLESTTVGVPGLARSIPLVRAEFSDSLLLNQGTQYWLGISANSFFGADLWKLGFGPGLVAFDFDPGVNDPWSSSVVGSLPGARVAGFVPVPEPSTYGLMAVLALGAVRYRELRKRRSAANAAQG